MPQNYPISKFYAVSYRPFDGDEYDNSLLCSSLKEFQTSDKKKISGSANSTEDGMEVRVRYKFKKGCLRWQKTSGRTVLQKSIHTNDGMFYLFSYNTCGILISKAVYNADLIWISTDYYNGVFKLLASLRPSGKGLIFKKYNENGKKNIQLKLFACPVQENGAQRSFVNNISGLPQVYAETDAGSFYFCTAEEKNMRMSAAKKAGSLKLEWPHEEKADLNFKYIENAPVPVSNKITGVNKNARTLSNKENNVTGPKQKISHAKPPKSHDNDLNFKKILPLNEMLKKMDELPISKWTALLNAQAVNEPEKESEGNEIQKNRLPEYKRKAEWTTKKSGYNDFSKHMTKYTVAAKGMSGVVIHADELKKENPPIVGLKESRLIPAKRIVVTSKESYLYFGELINGLRHGRGRTQMGNGKTAYEGSYCKDKRDGFGVYYYKSGKLCYVGGWKQNLRNGMGIAFGADDGSVFVGHWERDIPTGRGSAFDMDGNLLYTGGWKNGKRHGYGTEYCKGKVIRTGWWQSGEFSSGYSYKGKEMEK